jgi:Fur family ferric uptake transcriptional regulator
VSSPPDGLISQVTDRIALAGQRPTRNRLAIVEALRASTRPLTIHEILDAQPQLAQSSVYRNLVVLEAARTVRRIVTDHEYARYELAEDLTGHHHHLICIECGNVEDVPAPAGLERSVHSAAEQIARSTGFHTEHHRIDLLGRCKQCA